MIRRRQHSRSYVRVLAVSTTIVLSLLLHIDAPTGHRIGSSASDERARRLLYQLRQVMVGADLSGIEPHAVTISPAMIPTSRTTYQRDIHQANADKIGITRKLVKNVTYAFLCGAGDVKIDTLMTHYFER